jgi:hypothetical protein
MFNNRDLYILGGGALLAVLCLFLPLSFVGKVVIGFLVLVSFMVLALLRLGPDRVPPEVWMMRRFRYAMQTRKYVNQQGTTRRGVDEKASKKDFKVPSFGHAASSVVQPIDLAWGEVGVYPLLTAFLGVVGIYFSVWLANGGAQELSIWFR